MYLHDLVKYRNYIFMDTYTVMDVWSFYNLGFQTFDVFHF